jgi:hypothetical protein
MEKGPLRYELHMTGACSSSSIVTVTSPSSCLCGLNIRDTKSVAGNSVRPDLYVLAGGTQQEQRYRI